MKLFLDSASRDAIKMWSDRGILDGVTTNPTHLAHQRHDPTTVVREICSMMAGRDVSVEVVEQDPERIYIQARALARLAPNVVVKIPASVAYYEVIKKLASEGVPLNITLVGSIFQGLLLCKLGVRYISPFVGRVHDAGEDGVKLAADLAAMVREYGYTTQVLAASLRTLDQWYAMITAGVDVATISVDLLEKAAHHSVTDAGIRKFMDDWSTLHIARFPA